MLWFSLFLRISIRLCLVSWFPSLPTPTQRPSATPLAPSSSLTFSPVLRWRRLTPTQLLLGASGKVSWKQCFFRRRKSVYTLVRYLPSGVQGLLGWRPLLIESFRQSTVFSALIFPQATRELSHSTFWRSSFSLCCSWTEPSSLESLTMTPASSTETLHTRWETILIACLIEKLMQKLSLSWFT